MQWRQKQIQIGEGARLILTSKKKKGQFNIALQLKIIIVLPDLSPLIFSLLLFWNSLVYWISSAKDSYSQINAVLKYLA